jgi:hypothetical protein
LQVPRRLGVSATCFEIQAICDSNSQFVITLIIPPEKIMPDKTVHFAQIAVLIAACYGNAFAQGSLEIPASGAIESGIGVISGWHCSATDIARCGESTLQSTSDLTLSDDI